MQSSFTRTIYLLLLLFLKIIFWSTIDLILLSSLLLRLEEIGIAASKEYSLLKALDKMQLDWKELAFNLIPYKETVSYILCHHLWYLAHHFQLHVR